MFLCLGASLPTFTSAQSPASLPEYSITTAEVGYRHVKLTWSDDTTWSNPWIIQRSTTPAFTDPTDLTNNQAADNTAAGTYRFLGINANNYVDLDGLAEATTYYYRVASVLNLSEHKRNAAVPTFTTWKYGAATTGTLAASKKRTYDVTTYGAISGDGLNDYQAALDAMADANRAGGGIIYFPAGTWDIWPTDGAVDIVGGIPTLAFGESATSVLFFITSDNITFLGDASGGVPTTFVNLYLWGKEPATDYLSVLNGNGTEINARRYFVFQPKDIQNFTVRNMNWDMGANPVNTGKAWQSLSAKKTEWDISHKFFAAFSNTRSKNTVIDTVIISNCRGEIIYSGGFGHGKFLVKDCILGPSNSSTVSGSFDMELVNTVIRDSANASLESAIYNTAKNTDFATGLTFNQNHLARGCTFIGLDQSVNGSMKGLPGEKNFAGWHCFNESGTYQSVTDCTFTDIITAAFSPWYEYRNGLRFNCVFNEPPSGFSGNMIYTWTIKQTAYKLTGGWSEILWMGDTLNITRDSTVNEVWFYSQPGVAARGNQSPWIWDSVHFNNTGGPHTYHRLWVDIWNWTSGRQNVTWSNWTKSSDLKLDDNKFIFLGENHISPNFVNFFEFDSEPVDPGPTETIPNAPAGLVATVASSSQVDLSWSDNSSDESGFRLERRTGTGTFQSIASPIAGTTHYSDASVTNGTDYTYRIFAYNNAGPSSASNSQQVTIPGDPNPDPTPNPDATIAAPSNLTVKTNSASSISLYWVEHASSDVGYRVERQKEGEAFVQVAELSANKRTFDDTGLEPSTRYTYRVYAFSQSTASGYSNTASKVTAAGTTDPGPPDPGSTNSIPTGPVDETFSVDDIGTGNLGGTASYDSDNDMFRLSASGGQIWGTKDDFHYVYREVTGDVETTVKVSSLTAGDEFGKAGIMIRESSSEDSRHAFLTVSAGKGVALERRHEVGGGTTRSGKGNVAAPVWLRLIKEGTYISAFYSEDGDNWSFLSEDILNFSDTIFIGLAVAAHGENDSVMADFGELNIVELQSESATETFISTDIGKVGVNGDAAYDSQTDTFLIEASGGDIGHIQDAFHYVFREVSGDFEGVAKLESLVAAQDWTKAGLMIRGDVQPDSLYFSIFMAQNVGLVYQSRTVVAGGSDWSMHEDFVDPVWMKVTRQGNLLQAYYSQNGNDWSFLDENTVDLPDKVLFGMALTSHEEGTLAYAEFSNLSVNN